MSDLLGVLQQIMQENQQAMKPTELAFGTVVSVGPLSILVDNTAEPKPEAGLILTDAGETLLLPVLQAIQSQFRPFQL